MIDGIGAGLLPHPETGDFMGPPKCPRIQQGVEIRSSSSDRAGVAYAPIPAIRVTKVEPTGPADSGHQLLAR
jgi:hypothetical protein